MSGLRRGFMKNWFAVEALPIYAVVGIVVAGGSWYLTRLARGPTIVWTKENPTPWNDIKPNEGTKLVTVNQHFDKGLIFGAAAFSAQYNEDTHLASDVPVRTVRAALRYGINAFDTSAYYGPSEIVLGKALRAVQSEFPRQSYLLVNAPNFFSSMEGPILMISQMTKCGRYGLNQSDFDYSPATIRRSVERSLKRLYDTDILEDGQYLDVVYLHDIEFVCEQVQPPDAHYHALALTPEKAAEYGLAESDKARIRGPGDQVILDAVAELQKLKSEGKVRNIGITGYPLHTLLRVAILVHHKLRQPLDVVLSYSHLNIQNDTFGHFLPEFKAESRANVAQVIAASPLNMGLLTPRVFPWHPAPDELKALAQNAIALSAQNGDGSSIVDVALGYSYRRSREMGVPMVVGLSQLHEVHQTVKAWRRSVLEDIVRESFGSFKDWSWASP
ncbi:hypothetical protein EIP91_003220 [Steccherinum ochraceum]|uniref:NADP-dependent oxidoreductase domain-containing protein n=1 Tax=Steccherinum ochraceum TaxID=92696 RepID=A0A4R0RWZ4_9APHY|nr:hypothetical protein EIP91_003220 [Steccherinum ochraceum]